MGNHRRKQTSHIQRFLPPGVTPLEIWDCNTSQGILWNAMSQENFPPLLAQVVSEIQQGTAVSPSKGKITPTAMKFDSIYLAGGGSQQIDTQHALNSLGVPVIMAENPIFSGAMGGQHLLDVHSLTGPVVDIGQTQIKISGIKATRASIEVAYQTFKRNLEVLPIQSIEFENLQASPDKFNTFVGQSILKFIEDNGINANGMVLALPCWISKTGTLGGSSYAGMKGNGNLVSNIRHHSKLNNASVLLLNDAELTAYSAQQDQRLSGFRKTLVLTLGFGVGAALLEAL